MLPKICIVLPEGRRTECSITQPEGSIMWPVGGIFSCYGDAGVAYKHYYMEGPYFVRFAAHGQHQNCDATLITEILLITLHQGW